MIRRENYAVMAISEDDLIIDLILYKDYQYVGHIDATQDYEVIAAVLNSELPEEFAEVCGGCMGPTEGRSIREIVS